MALYQGLYVVFGLPSRFLNNKDKKIMEFPFLAIEELNNQQAWLIIGNNQTIMLHMFTVQHNQRTMSKATNSLFQVKLQ